MEPVLRKETKDNMEEGVPEAENILRNKDKTEKPEEEKGANGEVPENDESGGNIQKSEDEKKKKDISGGGILEQIISHLPDDIAVPTTEEASILIHSVID